MKQIKKIYGVLGFPAKHSLSPLMHNAAFQALKIDAEYKIFEIKPEDLDGFLKSLYEKNIYGLNVTVPYKEKVIPHIEVLSTQAKLIKAVNTIKVTEDKLEGFNTDGEGFIRHLKELNFSLEGKSVAILGAGGASKSVAVYLSMNKVKSISLYDIEKLKIKDLTQHLKNNFTGIEFSAAESIMDLGIEHCDLLINATPIGMKETDPLIIEEGLLRKDLFVYDLIYNPAQTKLLKIAQAKGAQVSNGLGMLLYQGAASFELWTKQLAPIEVMRKALNEGVKKICL